MYFDIFEKEKAWDPPRFGIQPIYQKFLFKNGKINRIWICPNVF